MFGEKAFELIKEFHVSDDKLPPFNDESIRQILEELQTIYDENQKDLCNGGDDEDDYTDTVAVRHIAFERNKRCLLAYLYNRLCRIRQLRWECGSILPADIKINLTNSECEWFTNYNHILVSYMQTIGENIGLNLTHDMKPPQSLYVEVRCLIDFGKLELDSGEIILLRKDGVYLLPRSKCEILIQKGVLEHII